MSKIICDVCGTSYPDTATQCPICGSARPSDVQTVSTDAETETASGYQYVKGGRFSNSNVRKRNKNAQSGEEKPGRKKKNKKPAEDAGEDSGEERRGKSSKGLVIAVAVLLLAVLAVVGFILVRFFLPEDFFGGSAQTAPQTVPCVMIQTAEPMVELNEAGQTYRIQVIRQPETTTDPVQYFSQDPSVAAVDAGGLVTAVGQGRTVITITCGNVSSQFAVTCNLVPPTEPTTEEPTTEPPTTEPPTEPPTTEEPTTEPPTTEAPTQPPEECVIKTQYGENRHNDVTIQSGDTLTFELYGRQSGEQKDAVWTLKQGTCCTLTGNKLQAVRNGVVIVSTVYQDTEYTFTVRVSG